MQFMAMIFNEGGANACTPSEMYEFIREMKEKGYHKAGDPLRDQSTAKCVSVRNGKISMRDGPFSETKEQLAGYFILDCPNIEVAAECCAKIPGAKIGSVEIRPLGTMP